MSTLKYLILGVVVLVVGIVGFGLYGEYAKDQAVVAVAIEKIDRPDLGFSFTYPSGEEAFSMIQSMATSTGSMLQAYVMMPTEEYFALEESKDARETPAAMSVFVFTDDQATTTTTGTTTVRLDRSERLVNWATANDSFTSFTRPLSPPEQTEIDGVDALHYRADGLYPQDIYLVSYKNRIYMFVTQFNAETDLTYTTFQELIASVSFD
ncbi:hypothetical protein K2Q16_01255 [Patescibacteria group bacterium]|nr:hypothetical protein [Patescibacteria group bacterium]